MYKHCFVAGDEVAPIEIQLNAISRISSIAVRHSCRTVALQKILVDSPVCQQKFFRKATVLQLRPSYPFIMVISKDPWHSHLLPRVWQWSCRCLFLRLSSVALTWWRRRCQWRTAKFRPIWSEFMWSYEKGGIFIVPQLYWDTEPRFCGLIIVKGTAPI